MLILFCFKSFGWGLGREQKFEMIAVRLPERFSQSWSSRCQKISRSFCPNFRQRRFQTRPSCLPTRLKVKLLAILPAPTTRTSSGLIFFLKTERAFLPLMLFKSLRFCFPWLTSVRFISEIQEKVTDYYKKMRGSRVFVRAGWLVLSDLHYNNAISQSTYWSDNEVEIIRF